MKKILLLAALAVFSLGFSQYNNGYGNNDPYYSNNNGWYDDNDYQFPDDYYYEYPNDYYDDGYYENYYNDYRRSIDMVNWSRFFVEFGLSRYQINMIIDLNSQFSSYNVWNSYYRMNPNRWYYDRFYALQRILGVNIFVTFQNRYYNGYSPVVYYTNYWNDFYRPRYRCHQKYRNVNVHNYYVNPQVYHQSVGNHYGWNQPRNPHNPGGFKEDNSRVGASYGSRDNEYRQNNGVRNSQSNSQSNSNVRSNNGGYRTPQRAESQASESPRMSSPRSSTNGQNIGTTEPRVRENNSNQSTRSSQPRMSTPRSNGNTQKRESTSPSKSSSSRSSGQRFISTR